MNVAKDFFMPDKSTCDSAINAALEEHVADYHTEKEQVPAWFDVVPHEEKKRFLQDEMEYTYPEISMFYKLEEGEEKEEFRKKILDKREIFLKKYMSGEIKLKPRVNTESLYDKFLKWVKV